MLKDLLPKTFTKKEIRKFALTIGIVITLIGIFLIIKKSPKYPIFFIIGGLIFISGLILPKILKPFYIGWMTLANILNWIMTRIILGILFFAIFTPISLISKIFGKQYLTLKESNNCESYWNLREKKEFDNSIYENQF